MEAPTSYSAECPVCGATMDVILPASPGELPGINTPHAGCCRNPPFKSCPELQAIQVVHSADAGRGGVYCIAVHRDGDGALVGHARFDTFDEAFVWLQARLKEDPALIGRCRGPFIQEQTDQLRRLGRIEPV